LGAIRSRDGVTLLEMLVVMVVIGLMAAISFPAVAAGIDSIRVNSASHSVAAFLNAALTRVERRQEPVEVIVSPGANTIRAYSNEPNSARQLTMPEGVSIESVLPDEPGAESADRRIILLPGGTAPGIGIQIANRRGARRIIRLDPATGFPRVESVISR
jgi:prepilin-type N-terminal cleavage/methylation domain-containing protein